MVSTLMLRCTTIERLPAIAMLLLAANGCAGRRPTTAPRSPAAIGTAFVATAYCQRGTTASGLEAGRGIVAADPAVLPLGTVIRIEAAGRHDGVYRVMDTGANVRGRRLDLFMTDCREAVNFGRRTVRVSICSRRAARE